MASITQDKSGELGAAGVMALSNRTFNPRERR
jgi:hypothetical protein